MTFTEGAHSAQPKLLSVLSILAATANWRLSVAKKHSLDNRNKNAAELLFAISSEPPSSLPDHLIAGIAAAQGIRLAAEETARKVGFSLHPSCLADFIEDLLVCVAEERVKVLSVFPGREGER